MIHFLEINIFGSLILLAFLFLANPLKLNTKANRWLGIFLLLWASHWIEEIITLSSGVPFELSPTSLVKVIQLLGPVAFFLCIKYFTNPNYKIPRYSIAYQVVP
ncbi:hypothetical protein K5X82_18565 [Halosquirtibacter xylanolyticus]|uniref:hypothetical protein n=1 Tax=Halosquirtibacter xylanolyticus TaxID=3374599 RepID=UPI003749956E|nr:hypothetical protein K5X82_18565 [Prolixibacteraceae bacterium]